MTKHIKMAPFNPSFDNKVTRHLALVEQWELLQMNQRQKLNRARKEATSGRDRKVKLLKEDELEKDVVYIRNVVCDVEKDVEDKAECYMYFDARYSDPNMHYDDKNDSWYVYFDANYSAGLFRNATKVQFMDSTNRWILVPPHHYWYSW